MANVSQHITQYLERFLEKWLLILLTLQNFQCEEYPWSLPILCEALLLLRAPCSPEANIKGCWWTPLASTQLFPLLACGILLETVSLQNCYVCVGLFDKRHIQMVVIYDGGYLWWFVFHKIYPKGKLENGIASLVWLSSTMRISSTWSISDWFL